MSAGRTTLRPPPPPTWRAVSSRSATVRATSATRPPSSAKRRAIERPMPRPAPVTRIVRSRNLIRPGPWSPWAGLGWVGSPPLHAELTPPSSSKSVSEKRPSASRPAKVGPVSSSTSPSSGLGPVDAHAQDVEREDGALGVEIAGARAARAGLHRGGHSAVEVEQRRAAAADQVRAPCGSCRGRRPRSRPAHWRAPRRASGAPRAGIPRDPRSGAATTRRRRRRKPSPPSATWRSRGNFWRSGTPPSVAGRA